MPFAVQTRASGLVIFHWYHLPALQVALCMPTLDVPFRDDITG
jgi:hypothetical protein